MANVHKRLDKMRNNPKDWHIDDIKAIADSFGIEHRSTGGSHVVFRNPTGAHVTIPAHRPIKPIYVRLFLDLVSSLEMGADDNGTDSDASIRSKTTE